MQIWIQGKWGRSSLDIVCTVWGVPKERTCALLKVNQACHVTELDMLLMCHGKACNLAPVNDNVVDPHDIVKET